VKWHIKVNGKIIFDRERASKSGKTVHFTKDIGCRIPHMDMDGILQLMAIYMKESGLKVIQTVMVRLI
jgi:hypothetical protein